MYVFSGLAMVHLLIFGGVLTFGGYDKAEWEIFARKESIQSSAFLKQHAVVHVSVIMHILPGYRVLIFGGWGMGGGGGGGMYFRVIAADSKFQ